jgi:hypothetical protein
VDEELWDEKDAVCNSLRRINGLYDGANEIAEVQTSRRKFRAIQNLVGFSNGNSFCSIT